MKIVLTEHKMKVKFDKPEREGNCWDKTHWNYGNLYLEGLANPIKISKNEIENSEDYNVITSDRFETFMEQSLIDDMLQASKSDGGLTLKSAVLIIGSLNVLGIGIIYVLGTGAI